MTVADLARRFHMSPLRMHRLLEPLVAAGLVEITDGRCLIPDERLARELRDPHAWVPLEPGDVTGLERTSRLSLGGKVAA